jgi:hypothetical protein
VWAGDNGKSTGGEDVNEGGGVIDKAVVLAGTVVTVAAATHGCIDIGGGSGGWATAAAGDPKIPRIATIAKTKRPAA